MNTGGLITVEVWWRTGSQKKVVVKAPGGGVIAEAERWRVNGIIRGSADFAIQNSRGF